MKNIKLLLLLLLVLSLWCCDKNNKSKKEISKITTSAETHICHEHNVPEDKCTRCNPSLIPEFKAKGDWCAEHNLPESQCVICNPSLRKEEQSVNISEESQQITGIRVTKAKHRSIEEILTVTGKIAPDTEKIYHVYPKISGEVVKVQIKVGDIVKQGDILAIVRLSKTNTEEEIISLYNGMVITENIPMNKQVDELTSVFTIVDLNNIYANFDVYEKDIGKIKIGQKIKVKSTAYPDKVFPGRIVFVSPTVDDKTRTVKIRAEIDNNEYLLKFNMFITAEIVISNSGRYLVIPTRAIQTLGEKKIVFVQVSDNEFIAREVKIGFKSGELSQVIEGLKQDEMVVTEGCFLLKSELLKSKLGAGCAE